MNEIEKIKNQFNLSLIEKNRAQIESLKRGDFILKAYPVGSIYLSVNEKSPEELFGGKWERILGSFLLGASPSFPLGSGGGSLVHSHQTKEHTLTESEMPSHSHATVVKLEMASGSNTGELNTQQLAIGKKGTIYTNANPVVITNPAKGGSSPHSHGATLEADSLPPYLAVNIWKRIS